MALLKHGGGISFHYVFLFHTSTGNLWGAHGTHGGGGGGARSRLNL